MRQALLRRRLLAPEPAREQLGRDVTAAEAERERKRQHDAAERDPERDEDHLLADAEMRERGRDGEQHHGPVRGASEQPGLRQSRVDGRDEDRAAEKVGEEPARDQYQDRREQRRHEREQKRRRAVAAGRGQRVDPTAGEEEENPPEGDEREHTGWWSLHSRAPQRGRHTPALHDAVEAERARDALEQEFREPPQDGAKAHEDDEHEQAGEDRREAFAGLEKSGPDAVAPTIAHGQSYRLQTTPDTNRSTPTRHGGNDGRHLGCTQLQRWRTRPRHATWSQDHADSSPSRNISSTRRATT